MALKDKVNKLEKIIKQPDNGVLTCDDWTSDERMDYWFNRTPELEEKWKKTDSTIKSKFKQKKLEDWF